MKIRISSLWYILVLPLLFSCKQDKIKIEEERMSDILTEVYLLETRMTGMKNMEFLARYWKSRDSIYAIYNTDSLEFAQTFEAYLLERPRIEKVYEQVLDKLNKKKAGSIKNKESLKKEPNSIEPKGYN